MVIQNNNKPNYIFYLIKQLEYDAKLHSIMLFIKELKPLNNINKS